MLTTIRVKNFALVEDTELQLEEGLSVFTGETGAGKSLLLNAIVLLLGSRASSSWVRKGAQKAEVEGSFFLGRDPERVKRLHDLGFEIEDPKVDSLVVRREFSAADSSPNRIWIQGKAATRSQLQEALGDLIEVSGQHEFLRLNKSGYVLEVLDIVAGNARLRSQYMDSYMHYRMSIEELNQLLSLSYSEEAIAFLKEEVAELSTLAQGKDLESLELQLERDSKILSQREKVLEHISRAMTLMDEGDGSEGLSPSIRSLSQNLQKECQKLLALAPDEKLAEALSEFANKSEELSQHLNALSDKWADSSLNAEEILQSLSLIRKTKRKYQLSSGAEIVNILQKKQDELKLFESSLENKSRLEEEIEKTKKELKTLASKLSAERKKASQKLLQKWEKGVRDLGMPHAVFNLKLETLAEPGPAGQDSVELLFSSNKGHEMQALSKVASGGELSRILLALKECVAGSSGSVGVYLFDEVDTGIGGETAHSVGEKLHTLSRDSQVLVVTHLAQIAAFADTHLRVEKTHESESSRSQLHVLSEKDRLEELARMLGGHKIASAKKLASDLISRVRREVSP